MKKYDLHYCSTCGESRVMKCQGWLSMKRTSRWLGKRYGEIRIEKRG